MYIIYMSQWINFSLEDSVRSPRMEDWVHHVHTRDNGRGLVSLPAKDI